MITFFKLNKGRQGWVPPSYCGSRLRPGQSVRPLNQACPRRAGDRQTTQGWPGLVDRVWTLVPSLPVGFLLLIQSLWFSGFLLFTVDINPAPQGRVKSGGDTCTRLPQDPWTGISQWASALWGRRPCHCDSHLHVLCQDSHWRAWKNNGLWSLHVVARELMRRSSSPFVWQISASCGRKHTGSVQSFVDQFLGKKHSEGKGWTRRSWVLSRPAGAESGSTEPCPGQHALSVLPNSRAGAACVGSGVVLQPHTVNAVPGTHLFLEAAPVLSWAAFVASGQVWAWCVIDMKYWVGFKFQPKHACVKIYYSWK